MRWLSQIRMRILMLFNRGQAATHLDEELRFHIERQIDENVAAGMSAEEARYAALRTFGNPALLRDQTRATWSWAWLESLLRDLRYGMRTLCRAPGFAVIAILVMALGIGANVALFTVVRSVLLKPLPFQDPSRLLMVYERGIGDPSQDEPFNVVAPGVYAEWRNQNRSFTQLALLGDEAFNLSGSSGELPEQVRGSNCTWNLLATLGVQPALGRNFTASDDRPAAQGTVLLSWSLWKRRFGGDPAILNQPIHLNTRTYTVIGILPAWFAFPNASTQLWTPVYHDKPEELMTKLAAHQFQVIGRLRPGFTAAQGVADLSLISLHLHNQHLDNAFVGRAANARPLLEDMVGDIKRPLYVLLAAASCVLLIACLNLANLLVARAASRRREAAIRSALGGGRWRLLSGRLIESFLLSAAGGVLGILFASAALRWLVNTRSEMSRAESVHIDPIVALFTLSVIVLCALFSGLISALGAGDRRAITALNESSRSNSAGQSRASLRKVLLSLEVGLTVVLLVGAGLLLKSYQRLRSADMGCVTHNVLTMRIGLFGGRFKDPAQQVNFFAALLERVRALPGVDAAGFTEAVPGQGYWGDEGFTIVEHPPLPQGQAQYAIDRWVDPGYFAAIGIPILRGHTFDPNRKLDQANQTVISASFARQFFPGEDPIGKHLHLDARVYEIVGIVGDTRYAIGEPPKPMQYYPLFAGIVNNGALVIRSSHDVEQLALPIQRVVQELDHDLPVSDVLTMDQLLGKSTLDESFDATLLAAFAFLSLVLAAVGLFGVLSYIVAQRTGEIGIRIALGAQREQVLRLMLLDGLRPAFLGLVFGLAASAAAVRLIRSMLYDTQPFDPAVFLAVAGTLLMVAALACIVPAWRASRLDPMQALRTE